MVTNPRPNSPRTAPIAATTVVDFSPVLGRTLIACCWTGTSSTGVTGVEVGPPDSPTGAAGGVSNRTRLIYRHYQNQSDRIISTVVPAGTCNVAGRLTVTLLFLECSLGNNQLDFWLPRDRIHQLG